MSANRHRASLTGGTGWACVLLGVLLFGCGGKPTALDVPMIAIAPAESVTPEAPSPPASPPPAELLKPAVVVTSVNIDTLPIFDVHFHPDLAWDPAALVVLFDRLGVARAAGGPKGPDRLGLGFAELYPDRVIPFAAHATLHSLNLAEGERSWRLQSPGTIRYVDQLEQGLRAGCWKGIGELFVNTLTSHVSRRIRFPADAPLMQRLWSLSATYGVPLSVHMDAEPASVAEMERLLASNRAGTWIWAHAGWFAQPSLLRRLMEAHPNLYADLSFRDNIRSRAPVDDRGVLRADWKELLEGMPDRIFIGTDVLAPTVASYTELIAYWRGILGQLSPDAAVKLAYENAERVLKLEEPRNYAGCASLALNR